MSTKTVTAVGVVPTTDGLWFLRLKAARFPFFLDSQMKYYSKEEAEKEAKRWEKRKITITVEP